MARQFFDNLDLKILHSLTANARTPYLEISREYGVSGPASDAEPCNNRLRMPYRPLDSRLRHLRLRRHFSTRPVTVQRRRRRTGKNSGSSGMPFHHRSVRHFHKAVCPQQRPPAPPAPKPDPGTRTRPYRNSNIIQRSVQTASADK